MTLALSALLLAGGGDVQAFDSVTAACRQRPEQCARVAGQEAVVPTVKGGAEVASAAATLRVLTAETKSALERALVECVQWAHAEVNLRHFGGQSPTRAQCLEVRIKADPCGREVTRGMQLGREKHELALQCARDRLSTLIPGRFSLEQRYRYDRRTGQKQLLSEQEARALLQKGCGDELVGTLVPDVVIHSENPLEIEAVYDFKFPCPSSNAPKWSPYPEGHPYGRRNQGEMYREALSSSVWSVSPVWGISP